jgi:hypothetical protein
MRILFLKRYAKENRLKLSIQTNYELNFKGRNQIIRILI